MFRELEPLFKGNRLCFMRFSGDGIFSLVFESLLRLLTTVENRLRPPKADFLGFSAATCLSSSTIREICNTCLEWHPSFRQIPMIPHSVDHPSRA